MFGHTIIDYESSRAAGYLELAEGNQERAYGLLLDTIQATVDSLEKQMLISTAYWMILHKWDQQQQPQQAQPTPIRKPMGIASGSTERSDAASQRPATRARTAR